MGLPNVTYTSKFIVDGRKDTLCIKNFYSTILTQDVNNPDHIHRISMGDFFLNHRNELSGIVVSRTINPEFFYKPKMYSLEIYGTTELWLSLLRLNNMTNVTDFYLPTIDVYEPNSLMELINVFHKRKSLTS